MLETDLQALWGKGPARAFISHVSVHRELAHGLKQNLSRLGIASFVAHDDIDPMTEWEYEIEKALFSMDVLLALLSADFRDSKWTDQEVGVAVGRGVRVVAFRLGADPYGFIGKYQAFSVGNDPGLMASEVFRYWLRGQYPGINAVRCLHRSRGRRQQFCGFKQACVLLGLYPTIITGTRTCFGKCFQ